MMKILGFVLLGTPLCLWGINPPPPGLVVKLFSQAVSARSFQNASIKEVMLTEPEKLKSGYRYGSEFSVEKKGRSFRCEEWFFSIGRVDEVWIVHEIKRGRCND